MRIPKGVDTIDLSGDADEVKVVEKITSKAKLLSIEDDEIEEIPKFAPEVIPEDEEDGDDFVRELTPHELDELRRRLARSASATPVPERSPSNSTSATVHLEPGMSVELLGGDFLAIRHIRRGGAELIGILLRRTRRVDDMLQKKCNELCAILKSTTATTDPTINECLTIRPSSDVLAIRKVVFTNRLFPALSFRERPEAYYYYSLAQFEEHATLVCRWKYITFCDVASSKVTSQSLMRLSEFECTPGDAISDVLLKNIWQGKKSAPQAAKAKTNVKEETSRARTKSKRTVADVDLTIDDESDEDFEMLETKVEQRFKRITSKGVYERRSNSITTEKFQASPSSAKAAEAVYTYGDICTGAGGMACGAKQAGSLKLNFFLDHWTDACETLKLNHDTKIVRTDIHTFCTSKPHTLYQVDILHISFPCQPHSPVHTVEGRNDEANIAAGYSAIPILQICKPRIVTFEQTSGIITHRGGWHFRALVHQLTAIDYSVRWKIVNCAEYGNVHARKRLIIIAAA